MIWVTMSILFIFTYISLYFIFIWLLRTNNLRKTTHLGERTYALHKIKNTIEQWTLIRAIRNLLQVVHFNTSIWMWLFVTGCTSLISLLIGLLFFQSIKGCLVLLLIGIITPYLYLRIRLVNIQLKARLEFLPALEVFYQSYLLLRQPNLLYVLEHVVKERRMTYPMLPVFERLYRNLWVQQNLDVTLRIFRMTLGHKWADYFSNMLYIAHTEGVDISTSLKGLIEDMRRSKQMDHEERNRLLEIRIANFTPILFLVLFIAINYFINPEHAYYYYFVDEGGKGLLLDQLLIIFASFLMGIWLSMKRI